MVARDTLNTADPTHPSPKTGRSRRASLTRSQSSDDRSHARSGSMDRRPFRRAVRQASLPNTGSRALIALVGVDQIR
jgi:hypothetical protein